MRESEVFLMRNTKRELNPYSFYDTEGLARHFERMAAEGWAPDRVGLFIRYRRIKPQKLRFAVAFYPDSDDTPEGEDVFIDYCEQAGWQHAVGAGALTFWGAMWMARAEATPDARVTYFARRMKTPSRSTRTLFYRWMQRTAGSSPTATGWWHFRFC